MDQEVDGDKHSGRHRHDHLAANEGRPKEEALPSDRSVGSQPTAYRSHLHHNPLLKRSVLHEHTLLCLGRLIFTFLSAKSTKFVSFDRAMKSRSKCTAITITNDI